MKKEIKIKVILMIAFLMLFVTAEFAEIGIAAVFNIAYNGVCYRDYVVNYYSAHPVLIAVAVLFWIGMAYFYMRETFNLIKIKLNNI